MSIEVIENSITKDDLKKIAEHQFGDFVKAVVDLEKGVIAIGAELHADEEALLIESGSRQENLWGVNVYPDLSGDEWIEFNSMINVRPSQGNRSRGVEDLATRENIVRVIKKLVKE